MLGTKNAWFMVLALILIYGGGTVLVITQNLFSLDNIESHDHFVIGSDTTNKFFVDGGVNEAFQVYNDYTNTYFRDPIMRGKSFDDMINEKLFTTMHLAKNIKEEYSWDYAAPDAKGTRLLTEV